MLDRDFFEAHRLFACRRHTGLAHSAAMNSTEEDILVLRLHSVSYFSAQRLKPDPHWYCGFLLQGLGRRRVSVWVEETGASVAFSGPLLRLLRNQYVVLWSHQARNRQGMVRVCCGCESQIRIHGEAVSQLYPRTGGAFAIYVGGHSKSDRGRRNESQGRTGFDCRAEPFGSTAHPVPY